LDEQPASAAWAAPVAWVTGGDRPVSGAPTDPDSPRTQAGVRTAWAAAELPVPGVEPSRRSG